MNTGTPLTGFGTKKKSNVNELAFELPYARHHNPLLITNHS